MKISINDLIIPVIVIGAAGWWGYSTWSAHVEKSNAEQARLEAASREDRALAEIAHQHQATRALTARLSEGGPVFTYQVPNALSAATGKAVIISGRLTDIEKHDGQYVLHLNESSVGSMVIRYVLECDPKIAEPIIAKRSGINSLTAVVQISSVEKAEFNLRGVKSADREPSLAPEDFSPFVARGRCLEIVLR